MGKIVKNEDNLACVTTDKKHSNMSITSNNA
jgi:hypothetical protein